MTPCQSCGWTGGYHSKLCTPAPAYRIEWCGNIQVHQPVRSAK